MTTDTPNTEAENLANPSPDPEVSPPPNTVLNEPVEAGPLADPPGHDPSTGAENKPSEDNEPVDAVEGPRFLPARGLSPNTLVGEGVQQDSLGRVIGKHYPGHAKNKWTVGQFLNHPNVHECPNCGKITYHTKTCTPDEVRTHCLECDHRFVDTR